MSDRRASLDPLREAFGAASPSHYAWRISSPYVADEERALVREAFLPLEARVLDVGCGEGATLVHLGAGEGAVGVDLFEDKIAFAREKLPQCRFVVASALDLPFDDRSFDQLILRDVVHHIDDVAALAAECARVLAPGGRIDVLEPCRYNPLIFAHGALLPVEHGELRSTASSLRGMLAPHFTVTGVSHHQPLPLHRIVFHPDMGAPSLAEHGVVQLTVRAVERLAAFIMPRAAWAYLHVRAFK